GLARVPRAIIAHITQASFFSGLDRIDIRRFQFAIFLRKRMHVLKSHPPPVAAVSIPRSNHCSLSAIEQSGERTRLACWFRRHAETIFSGSANAGSLSSKEKFVIARRAHQHARRVRSPDMDLRPVALCELLFRLSVGFA